MFKSHFFIKHDAGKHETLKKARHDSYPKSENNCRVVKKKKKDI